MRSTVESTIWDPTVVSYLSLTTQGNFFNWNLTRPGHRRADLAFPISRKTTLADCSSGAPRDGPGRVPGHQGEEHADERQPDLPQSHSRVATPFGRLVLSKHAEDGEET